MRKNKAQLIGNVGKDPEIRTFDNGDKIATFPFATSESWKDAQGEKKESTEWHNIVARKKNAELVEKYVRKGAKLAIEGKITSRKYQDRDGNDRYTTEIVIYSFLFLDKPTQQTNQGQSSAPAPAPESYEPEGDLPF